MDQWFDSTLIAIHLLWSQGVYVIMELPARQLQWASPTKQTFDLYEDAEQYINEQYIEVVVVEKEDIEEEIERRKHLIARDQLLMRSGEVE